MPPAFRQDRQIAQQRLYILHLKLRGFVQRREQSVLAAMLPPKEEYVLTIRLSRMSISCKGALPDVWRLQ